VQKAASRTRAGEADRLKELAHGGNPVTRWMAANVAVAQDPAGNLKPARDKSTESVDGIVALIMAIGRTMVVQEEPQSAYSLFFCLRGQGCLAGEKSSVACLLQVPCAGSASQA
jgi:hypothetical protein